MKKYFKTLWNNNNNSKRKKLWQGMPTLRKRKISNNLNLHFKELKKKRPQDKNSRRKELIKNRAEINETSRD